jgi:hypothetical protein
LSGIATGEAVLITYLSDVLSLFGVYQHQMEIVLRQAAVNRPRVRHHSAVGDHAGGAAPDVKLRVQRATQQLGKVPESVH